MGETMSKIYNIALYPTKEGVKYYQIAYIADLLNHYKILSTVSHRSLVGNVLAY